MVHFLGKTKPWSYTYDPKSKQISGNVSDAATHPTFLLDWWELYSSAVVPALQEQFGDQPFHSGCVEVTERLTPPPFRLQMSLMNPVELFLPLVGSGRETRKICKVAGLKP